MRELTMIALTAVALCLLSTTSPSQAATNRIAIFDEPYFPYYMSDSRLTPVRVQGWLRDCGLEADLLSAVALADPARFNTARYALLVHVYGNTYPQGALPNIRAFHQAGGCMLLVGGTPFCHPCVPGGARGWLFGPADRTQPVRDEQVAHSGKASVRLGPSKGDWFGPGTTEMPAKGGEVYSVGAWMRTSADLQPDERTRLYVRCYDNSGTFCGQGGPQVPRPGSDWTWVAGTFTTAPQAATIDVSMQMWCQKGTVWLDDVVLTRGPRCDPSANLVEHPGFEELPNRAMQLTQVGGGGQSSCLPPRNWRSGTGSTATACCASR